MDSSPLPPSSPSRMMQRPRRTHPPSHPRSECTTLASLPLPSLPTLPLPLALAGAGPAPGGLSKPFQLGDVARAALARPRPLAPWAPDADASPRSEDHPPASPDSEDDDSDDSDEDARSSYAGSPSSSNVSTPFSSPPSSCALTPTSSSEGWTPSHLILRPVEEVEAPPALASPPLASPQWTPESFSLKLLFTSAASPTIVPDDDDHSLPPAFFPSARISFSPRLRVTAPGGLAYSALGGMHLGVTGMCETLDSEGNVKSKRMIADFCTDLSSGINIWKRDGKAARSAATANYDDDGEGDDDEQSLPQGTYVLPLTMKIPNSERLPPSFECPQFRIYYTMSIALFSVALTSDGTPRRLKVFSVPFHILPSTLPTPPPELPVLTHDHKKGVFASILKSLSFTSPKPETGYHVVFPSLPTSHFSPASHASIPVTLRIVDRPLEPTDLYIRLALVRKTYVRESHHSSLATAIEDEWGLGIGVSPAQLGYTEETVLEPWCRDEEEIVSRWGWVPYSSRPGADPSAKAEVVIQDIALPLSGLHGEGWTHGYSTSLDIEPTAVPSQAHGDCSWFSPAFRTRPPVAKEYGRHIHVSSRFYLSVQVGFATPQLRETLVAIGAASPDMEIAAPNSFTSPTLPSTSRHSGHSLSNPFAAQTPRTPRPSSPASPTSSPFNTPAFPGKLRELFIPLTIGSVAEPAMSCIAGVQESSQQRREREEREERGEDLRSEGEGPEGAWMCAPPLYEEALKCAPAYVFAQA
ncbi:hypothetical protein RQP46_004181 [Phenoliferia psychrophenolica]